MQKQTVALIDDDRNILTSLSIALEKEGFKVQTYIDGESALIGLTRTPPDLAVIDIKMPSKNVCSQTAFYMGTTSTTKRFERKYNYVSTLSNNCIFSYGP